MPLTWPDRLGLMERNRPRSPLIARSSRRHPPIAGSSLVYKHHGGGRLGGDRRGRATVTTGGGTGPVASAWAGTGVWRTTAGAGAAAPRLREAWAWATAPRRACSKRSRDSRTSGPPPHIRPAVQEGRPRLPGPPRRDYGRTVSARAATAASRAAAISLRASAALLEVAVHALRELRGHGVARIEARNSREGGGGLREPGPRPWPGALRGAAFTSSRRACLRPEPAGAGVCRHRASAPAPLPDANQFACVEVAAGQLELAGHERLGKDPSLSLPPGGGEGGRGARAAGSEERGRARCGTATTASRRSAARAGLRAATGSADRLPGRSRGAPLWRSEHGLRVGLAGRRGRRRRRAGAPARSRGGGGTGGGGKGGASSSACPGVPARLPRSGHAGQAGSSPDRSARRIERRASRSSPPCWKAEGGILLRAFSTTWTGARQIGRPLPGGSG